MEKINLPNITDADRDRLEIVSTPKELYPYDDKEDLLRLLVEKGLSWHQARKEHKEIEKILAQFDEKEIFPDHLCDYIMYCNNKIECENAKNAAETFFYIMIPFFSRQNGKINIRIPDDMRRGLGDIMSVSVDDGQFAVNLHPA